MKTGELTVTTQIIGSNDNQNTYEVRRTWDENGKTAIVIELYPTISVTNIDKMDLSTMHLMNHTKELGWGSVRIVNLYSTVFDAKPRTSMLLEDEENMEYLKTIFSQKDIKEQDIVIAWGSGLSNHLLTSKKKLEILELIAKKKLDGLVMCIESEYMLDEDEGVDFLPLDQDYTFSVLLDEYHGNYFVEKFCWKGEEKYQDM